jgi:DNA-binding transcriptional LysR family regulator
LAGHLERLQAFLAVAEQQSFSKAARRLNLSPPVITRLIADLEAELGVQLFIRTTRQVSLTAGGAQYQSDVRPLLANLAQADESMRQQQHALAGELRVNAPMSFGQKFLPTAISRFRILHHGVNITLTLDDGFIDITRGQFDMALRISEPPADKSTIWRKMCHVPRVFVAAPDYLQRKGTPSTAAELDQHDCLGYAAPGEKPLWKLVARKSLLVDKFCFTCNNGDVLADLAAAGEGIALLPHFIVSERLRAGSLVTVLEDWRAPRIWLTAYYPPYTILPAKLRVFTDFMTDAMAEMFATN